MTTITVHGLPSWHFSTEPTDFGWYATRDDYDGAEDAGWPSCAIGHGNTEKEAIEDLLEQLED